MRFRLTKVLICKKKKIFQTMHIAFCIYLFIILHTFDNYKLYLFYVCWPSVESIRITLLDCQNVVVCIVVWYDRDTEWWSLAPLHKTRRILKEMWSQLFWVASYNSVLLLKCKIARFVLGKLKSIKLWCGLLWAFRQL